MAEPKVNELMEKIVSLCKRRGFVYPSSEIYGGIAGFWDYGPHGAELKRNVKDLWWRTMVHQRDDVAGLEATIIMAPQIWKASGHVDTFADMMRECPMTGKRVRADQVEPQSGTIYRFLGCIRDAKAAASLIEMRLTRDGKPDAARLLRSVAEALNRSSDPSLQDRGFAEARDLVCALLPEAGADPLAAETILRDLLENHLTARPTTVLVKPDERVEVARRMARDFYWKRVLVDFNAPLELEVIAADPPFSNVEKSIDYHPDTGFELTAARPFNLMLQTYVGPIQSEESIAYLRPETAQAIFAQFKNVLETSRQRVPFGIAQVGKAFRNEVTPRNFTFRSREFEQMELEFFIRPDEAIEAIHGRVASLQEPNLDLETPQPDWGWEVWHKYWVEQRIRFYEGIGLPRTTLEEYWQKPEELAHYAKATVDILFKFPFGTQELEGIAARGDFDLSQHQRFSGKPMTVFDEELKAAWAKLPKEKQDALWRRYFEARRAYLVKTASTPEETEKAVAQARTDADGLGKGWYVPHVIEPSAGVDRLILALISNAYSEVTDTDDKGRSETRVILRFHPRVAPIKVGVFPLLKNKPDLVTKARQVRDLLRPHVTVFYDEAGSIGRRYARQDEAGTPFGVTIDFDTLGETPALKDTVTVRHRDDARQERVPISGLPGWLSERLR